MRRKSNFFFCSFPPALSSHLPNLSPILSWDFDLSFCLTGIPSAPRDLTYEVVGSNVLLTWRLPKDLGGRKDVFFNVICKVCPAGSSGPCVRCGDSVQFEPRQVGLTESRVQVSNLLARVQYTFEIQAVNLVTELSSEAPHFATINVSTSQSGEETPASESQNFHFCLSFDLLQCFESWRFVFLLVCCAFFSLARLVPWFHFCPSHSSFLWMSFSFFPLGRKTEFSS